MGRHYAGAVVSWQDRVTAEVRSYLAAPADDRLREVCSVLERFLSELPGGVPLDGVIAEQVKPSPTALRLSGHVIRLDDQQKVPLSGQIRVTADGLGSCYFTLGNAVLFHGDPPLISEVRPVAAATLATCLLAEGESELAATVAGLRFHGSCKCGEDTCQSFYTAPKPDGSFGAGHRNLMFSPPSGGMLVIDVVDTDIHFVELMTW